MDEAVCCSFKEFIVTYNVAEVKLAVTLRGQGLGSYCDIWLLNSRNYAIVPHPGVVAYSKSLNR